VLGLISLKFLFSKQTHLWNSRFSSGDQISELVKISSQIEVEKRAKDFSDSDFRHWSLLSSAVLFSK